MDEQVTLFSPDAPDASARAPSSGFPIDLLGQSAGRLRTIALLYAFVFFMGGILPALLFPGDRARFLGSFVQWGPSVAGIAVALLLVAVIRSPRVSLPTAVHLGLVFEIASSYAIAAAEFADPMALENAPGHVRALLGRRLGRAVHGRRADASAPGADGRPGLGQRGSCRRRAHACLSCHVGRDGSGTVLLRPRLSLSARRRDGLCRCTGGLSARNRGEAREGAGELPPGAEARRGRTSCRVRRRSLPPNRPWEPNWTAVPTSTPPGVSPTGS